MAMLRTLLGYILYMHLGQTIICIPSSYQAHEYKVTLSVFSKHIQSAMEQVGTFCPYSGSVIPSASLILCMESAFPPPADRHADTSPKPLSSATAQWINHLTVKVAVPVYRGSQNRALPKVLQSVPVNNKSSQCHNWRRRRRRRSGL